MDGDCSDVFVIGCGFCWWFFNFVGVVDWVFCGWWWFVGCWVFVGVLFFDVVM